MFLDPVEQCRSFLRLVESSALYLRNIKGFCTVKKGSSSYGFKSAFKLDFIFNSIRRKEVGEKGARNNILLINTTTLS